MLSISLLQYLVTVAHDYDFQIVRKDTQEPINIVVFPKRNNTYRIKFQPLSVTSYTLKATQKPQHAIINGTPVCLPSSYISLPFSQTTNITPIGG
jgi:hypothetical protein